MAETADYDPGEWKGHDFSANKKAYDAKVGRGYADASAAAAKGVTLSDMVPEFIETQAENPLHILCDVTGSMGEWPAVIFSKLPYLDLEGKTYLGEDMEISFAAIGDVKSDKYPLQVRPYSKGTDLVTQLGKLIPEGGGGGGDVCESYEMGALYYAYNARMPKAVRPILIFIGDENLRDSIEEYVAKSIHVTIKGGRASTNDVFEELKRRYSVYIIRKAYAGRDAEINKRWKELLGDDHVVPLQAPERVVDVIFGILARETGMVDYFRKELEGRQSPEQVNTVYTSLKTVHAHLDDGTIAAAVKKAKGKSVMAIPSGKKTKGLLSK